MKKIPFALILACGLASGSAFAATQGTVTINGEVVDHTCEIVSGDVDKTVTLATVSTTAFAAADQIVAPQTFTIGLENCNAGVDVYAAFFAENGASIDTSTHTLVNTAPEEDAATNVNIALFEESGRKIELGNPLYNSGDVNAEPPVAPGAETKRVAEGSTSTTLVYSAAYYSTDAAVGAGTVTAKANYVIAYQ